MSMPSKMSAKSAVCISLFALAAALPATVWAQDSQTAASSSSSSSAAPAKPAPQAKPAQATPAATAQGDNTTTSDGTTVVTVTAEKPILQHKIDRDVYDVKQDPQAATGAASDVLNNVPAVTVDNDGTVSLRGNSNVQVYVNGKKSAQMQGDNRAFTLQSLAADDIDSVEVIPNPGAAFGADTAGGIINIVMKRGRAIKPQTSFNITAGDQGRAGLGIRSGKTFGKLKLNGSLNLNHGSGGNGRGGGGGGSGGSSPKVKSLSDRETLDPTTGAVTREDVSHNVSKSSNSNVSANLTAEYDFDESTDLTGDVNYSRRASKSVGSQETLSYDGNHNLLSDVARLSNSSSPTESQDMRLTFDHRGAVGTTEDFKMQLSHSANLSDGLTTTRTISHQPSTADTYTTRASKSRDTVDEFSGDWSHPLGDYDKTQQQLQLGWSVQHTVSDNYNFQSLALAAPVASPASPNTRSVAQFDDDQVLSAAYATYQRQFGALGIQAGLRVEDLHEKIDASNPTTAAASAGTRDEVNYSPSLFVTYKLSEKDGLKFVYSRKITRPSGRQLDPLIVFSEDGLSATSGNSALKSAKTDKYEVDFNHDAQLVDFSAQAYYNSTTGNIDPVISFLPSDPTVLLTSYQNSGTTHNEGISANISAHTADRKINLMFSPNYGYTTGTFIDPTTHLLTTWKGPNSSANFHMFYKLDPTNTLVFGTNYRGKKVSSQGYTTAQTSLNASWMHQIIPSKMVLVFNASNFLVGPTQKSVTESAAERAYSERYDQGASFMVSLRYTFGQPVKRNFDGPPRGGRGFGPDGPGGGPGGPGGPGGGGGGGGFGGGPGGF